MVEKKIEGISWQTPNQINMKWLLILVQIIKCLIIILVALLFLLTYIILLVLGFFLPKKEVKSIADDFEDMIRKIIEV